MVIAVALAAALAAQDPAPPHPPAAAPVAATRLVYDLPAYDVGRLLDARPGTSIDVLMTDLLSRLRAQLGQAATVTALGGTQFAVDVRDAAAAAALRPRIETTVLEMRVVAAADFEMDGVSFDLRKEKARLEAWLRSGGKELVLADPRAIARFNADGKQGPLAFEHLRWVPHLIAPQLADPAKWDHSYQDGVQPLADATVAVFAADDWNSGRVPDARRKETHPFLLEYVAINWREVSFSGADLDPNGINVGAGPNGKVGLNYQLRDEKAAAYADWSQKYIRHHTAMIVDGTIVSAPYFLTRIASNGQISGNYTQAEVEALAARLRGGCLPIAPVLLRKTPAPK